MTIPKSFNDYDWADVCKVVSKETLATYVVQSFSSAHYMPNNDGIILGAIENVCCGMFIKCDVPPMEVIELVKSTVRKLQIMGSW